MTDIFRPSSKNHTYTDSEMDQMSDILLIAKEITDDEALYRLVQGYMLKKVDSIKSIDDLRAKLEEVKEAD